VHLSSTMAEDLQKIHNVSIIGCSQSIPSPQTSKFEMILDQRVQAQTTHLAADYELLSAETTKLRQLVKKKWDKRLVVLVLPLIRLMV